MKANHEVDVEFKSLSSTIHEGLSEQRQRAVNCKARGGH